MLPLQQIKPKNARSKREFAKREPLQTENPKTALFLRYTSSSDLLNSLMKDLYTYKKPYTIRFTKGNPIHPFEDASSFEFFSQKNDASQILFASHSKKRPHALTWVRCFNGHVLDMLELCIDPESARCISQFKGEKCRLGIKPMLAFSGTAFDDPSRSEYMLAKSIFSDFFRGAEADEVDVEGLQLLISFFVGEDQGDGLRPPIQMRCYKLITKKSGTKVPKVETLEIGPRIDFRLGRVREANAATMKEALKQSKGTEAKAKKNVETDLVGDKMGRIHLGRQDLSKLQTRKMKSLKRHRGEGDELNGMNDEDMISEVESSDDGGVEVKRLKAG